MDNVTHSLFALTLARTRLRPEGGDAGATTAVLLLSSNAPDIDIVAAFAPTAGSYLAAHRGWTHGALGVAALALACTALVALLPRLRRDPDRPRLRAAVFRRLTLVALAGAALHVAMDLPTTYGTRLLSPFLPRWYGFDWLPIVDIVLWIILAGGLLAGRGEPRRQRRLATVVFVLMAVHYAVHATGHAAAVAQHGGSSTWRISSWSGEPPQACDDDEEACPSLAAIPTLVEASLWTVVRPTADGYDIFQADVLTGRRSPPTRVPNESNAWTARARQSPLAKIFYSFSRFPAARVIRDRPDGATVRMHDVRFGRASRDGSSSVFVVTIDLDRDGRVLRERFGR